MFLTILDSFLIFTFELLYSWWFVALYLVVFLPTAPALFSREVAEDFETWVDTGVGIIGIPKFPSYPNKGVLLILEDILA